MTELLDAIVDSESAIAQIRAYEATCAAGMHERDLSEQFLAARSEEEIQLLARLYVEHAMWSVRRQRQREVEAAAETARRDAEYRQLKLAESTRREQAEQQRLGRAAAYEKQERERQAADAQWAQSVSDEYRKWWLDPATYPYDVTAGTEPTRRRCDAPTPTGKEAKCGNRATAYAVTCGHHGSVKTAETERERAVVKANREWRRWCTVAPFSLLDDGFGNWSIPDAEPWIGDWLREWCKLSEVAASGVLRDWGEHMACLSQTFVDFEDRVREKVTLEITEQLLASPFALGDGTRVTWGTATVEQHSQRIEMLLGFAVANAHAARRHQAAVEMITTAGVSCLSEVSA